MTLTSIGVRLAESLLLLFSVLSVAIMIERAWSLTAIKKAEMLQYLELRKIFQQGDAKQLGTVAANAGSPSARALHMGLIHGSADIEIQREAIAQEVVVQTSHLQRNLVMLATIASTAPYIGLFGTVVGILNAFSMIASTGHTGASVVAGGISEALVTTALGLGVAIPSVMAYNYFNGRVGEISLIVETHATDLASRLPDLPHASPESNHRARNPIGAMGGD
jgi:biopolymer transport protein ExbB/TolQ